MPIEYVLLKDAPVTPVKYTRFYGMTCPECRAWPYKPFMRGQVQSWWRKLLGLPYCCIICERCKQIIGYEKPEEANGNGRR